VKEKNQPDRLPKNINFKTSASNLFLNVIIIALAVLTAFLIYSLYTKIKGNAAEPEHTEVKKSAASMVQVEVLNGCGAGGVADKFTEFLRKNNFDVVQVGNYISFDIDKSMVIDRTGNKANAFKVAEALGIDKTNVIQQINNDYFLDVSIIIGKDFNQLKPTK
jgi:hypothetical protein